MGRGEYAEYEEIAKEVSTRELSTLLKVGSSLASTLDLTEVLQIAIESVIKLLGLNTGAIYTLENDTLYLGATTPPLPPQLPEDLLLSHLNDHPHIKNTVSTKAPVYLDDARTTPLSPAEKAVVEFAPSHFDPLFPFIVEEGCDRSFYCWNNR